MSHTISLENRGVKFSVFLLGVTLPLVAILLWSARKKQNTKQRVEDAQMVAVEDSFPASDPPAAW